MKKLFAFVSMTACFGAALFTSCSKEDVLSESNDKNGSRSKSVYVTTFLPYDPLTAVNIYNPDRMGNSLAMKIKNCNCHYWVEDPQHPGDSVIDWNVFYEAQKYLPDYYCVPSWNDLELFTSVQGTKGEGVEMDPERDDMDYIFATLDEWKAPAQKELKSYYEAKGTYMNRPEVVCAGIGSGAKVYADKVLFGREPGEDLADMFYVDLTFQSMILSYPEFKVVSNCFTAKSPVLLSEFLAQGNALFGVDLTTRLVKAPEENYDMVTFTVEIPVTYEKWKHVFNHLDCHYSVKEGRWDIPTNQKVLKGTVQVKVGE